MDYMKIGSSDFPYPNGFQPEHELVKAATLTAADGTTYADVVGWKYANMKFVWGSLTDEQLQNLIESTSVGDAVLVEFKDPFLANSDVSVEAVRVSAIATKTRLKRVDGSVVWRDVTCEFEFPRCYSEEV